MALIQRELHRKTLQERHMWRRLWWGLFWGVMIAGLIFVTVGLLLKSMGVNLIEVLWNADRNPGLGTALAQGFVSLLVMAALLVPFIVVVKPSTTK